MADAGDRASGIRARTAIVAATATKAARISANGKYASRFDKPFAPPKNTPNPSVTAHSAPTIANPQRQVAMDERSS
jgi:hypothetical protein